jgi:chromosome segregation ATPase
MIAEAKQRIAQLVEVNRALTCDLDISHRNEAEAARQRDRLLDQVAALKVEVEQLKTNRPVDQASGDLDSLRGELAREQDRSAELQRELDVVLLDSQAVRARAYRAEESLRLVDSRLEQLEEERNLAVAQLGDSTAAMEDIRCRLYESLDESMLWSVS